MPVATPFHPRTQPLNQSYLWKDWSGYCAVRRYDSDLGWEYSAFRNRAGLLDVSPLFKLRVRGPDAERVLDRMVPRDVSRQRVGQVAYTPWCDDRGKVLDDGTLQRLGPAEFRVTSALSQVQWLGALAEGLQVSVEDESEAVAALSLQGPQSWAILRAAGAEAAAGLRFFHVCDSEVRGIPVQVSRTGYTGDLGYELWMPQERALGVWDALMEAGAPYGITPAGLDALDVARLEAGLILIDVDYVSSRLTALEIRKSTPFEIGLGWCVHLEKSRACVGRAALLEEARHGPARTIVGLQIEWPRIERLFADADLPPELSEGVCRDPVPVYEGEHQVGYVTSHAFSPILKKWIGLATVEAPWYAPGRPLEVEQTVEHRRRRALATVVERPFFDPPRKRARTPGPPG